MSGVTLYAELTPDVAAAARAAAERIRLRMSRTASHIIAIGTELRDMKARLGHGYFLPWIEAEFGMSDRTALNFMRVADTFKSETVSDLPPTVLYALAAPSMPEEVREEAMRRAEAGEPVDLEVVADLKRQLVDAKEAAKGAKQDVKVQKSEVQRARDERDRFRNELDFANSRLNQMAEEIERLKQDGVIHVYSSDPQPAPPPVVAPAPAVAPAKSESFIPTLSAIIADGCRRDLDEVIGMLRAEGLYSLAEGLEAAARRAA